MAIFGIFLFQFCFAGQASAAPQYDSQAWKKFIENNETAKLPSGLPTGPAAVSRWNGKTFWDRSFIRVASPIDMSKKPGMNFSDQAKEYKAVYASQTMADFLEATLAKFRELTNDSSIAIPIKQLLYNQDNIVPSPDDLKNVYEVRLGIFGIENGKTVSYPGANFRQSTFSLSDEQPLNAIQHQYYAKLCNEQKETISRLSSAALFPKTRALWRQANDLARKALGFQPLPRLREAKERTDYLKVLSEAKTDEERKAIMDKHYEEAKAQDLKDAEELNNTAAARQTGFPKNLLVEYRKINDLDYATTWFLIEAILTQTAAEVQEIRLPHEFTRRLIEYAQNNGRPTEVISKYQTLIISTNGSFTIVLGCSIRDRFLGCQIKSGNDVEEKVNALASQMLKLAEDAPVERKFEILQLVVNADPSTLTYAFNPDYLVKEASTPEKRRLLTQFRKIPLNGLVPNANRIDSIGVRTDKKNNKNNKRQTQTRPDETRIGLPF